jgi:hypothetical protein
VRTVGAGRDIALAPERALALWADLDRWPAFVEGFARVVELDSGWPSPGARVVWESGPEGRGRVSERVLDHDPERVLVTEVAEEPLGGGPRRLSGRQTLEFVPASLDERAGGGEGTGLGELARRAEPAAPSATAPAAAGPGATAPVLGSPAELWLDYELERGPGPLTDLLFVRRAIHDALARTLERFAAETEGEAAR